MSNKHTNERTGMAKSTSEPTSCRQPGVPTLACASVTGTRHADTAPFTVGMEEEYFLADARTLAAPHKVPADFFRRAATKTRNRAKQEFLQAQVEVVSGVHSSMGELRHELGELRESVAETADEYGLSVLAAGTHPIADWRRSARQTKAPRYDRVMDQLQMTGRRDMMCGLHVHIELPEPGRRVEIMLRMLPYIPLLLVLSTSSPFWAGTRTGLKGYRLAAYNELPRTGLPVAFRTDREYRIYMEAMKRAGAIPDASYLWWGIRVSQHHPTLELRAPDCCTRLDDAIVIAALYRVLARRLCRVPADPEESDGVAGALAVENMWRAQRYGVQTTFVTLDGPEPVAALLDRVLHETAEDAAALDCAAELERCRAIVANGTSADVQLAIYERHEQAGHRAALRAVAQWLRRETLEGVRADGEAEVAIAPRSAHAGAERIAGEGRP
jgi:carboxylate-amine ligase